MVRADGPKVDSTGERGDLAVDLLRSALCEERTSLGVGPASRGNGAALTRTIARCKEDDAALAGSGAGAGDLSNATAHREGTPRGERERLLTNGHRVRATPSAAGGQGSAISWSGRR